MGTHPGLGGGGGGGCGGPGGGGGGGPAVIFCSRMGGRAQTGWLGKEHTPPKVPMRIVLRISRASSEWPTSSKDSVASLPGRGIGI